MEADVAYLDQLEEVRMPHPNDSTRREAKHIPPEEVRHGVYHLHRGARSADEEESPRFGQAACSALREWDRRWPLRWNVR